MHEDKYKEILNEANDLIQCFKKAHGDDPYVLEICNYKGDPYGNYNWNDGRKVLSFQLHKFKNLEHVYFCLYCKGTPLTGLNHMKYENGFNWDYVKPFTSYHADIAINENDFEELKEIYTKLGYTCYLHKIDSELGTRELRCCYKEELQDPNHNWKDILRINNPEE